MAMIERDVGIEAAFPGYSRRRREGVSDALADALMMLVAPQALAPKVPRVANMDEMVTFVKGLLRTPSRGREYIPLMKQEVKWSAERALKASKKPYSPEQFKEVMDEATRRQWYREAYEVLSGKMPPWGELKSGKGF